jgi:hypothetical protein
MSLSGWINMTYWLEKQLYSRIKGEDLDWHTLWFLLGKS